MARRTALLIATILTAALAGPVAGAGAEGFTPALQAGTAVPSSPAVGLLGGGTAGAAWIQDPAGSPHLVAAVRPPGGIWSAPQDLGPTDPSTPPRIARSGSYLALVYRRSGAVALATLNGTVGATWVDRGDVSVGSGTLPRVAGAADGQLSIAYLQAAPVVRRGAPEALGPAEVVSGAGQGVNDLDVARLGSGRTFLATSARSTVSGTTSVTVGQRESGASFASGPDQVEVASRPAVLNPGLTEIDQSLTGPRVAATATDATVVWKRTSSGFLNGTTEVVARRLTQAGTLGPAQSLATATGVAGFDVVDAPEVVADDQGTTSVVFGRSAENGSPAALLATSHAAGEEAFPAPVSVIDGPSTTSSGRLAASGPEALAVAVTSGGVLAARRTGPTFGPAVLVPASGRLTAAAGGDGLGQFVVGSGRDGAPGAGLATSFFDRAPPVLDLRPPPAIGVPAGEPLSFGTLVADDLSVASTPTWAFGDGSGTLGGFVQHSYRDAGSYAVTVSSVDQVGNVATARLTAAVRARPLKGPPPPGTELRATGLRLTRTGLRLTLSQAATVRVSAARRTCRAIRRQRRCMYARRPTTRTYRDERAGTRTLRLTLPVGVYRVTVRLSSGGRTATATRVLTRPRR